MNLIQSNLTFIGGVRNDNPISGINTIFVHHLQAYGLNWTVQNIHQMHISEHGWNGIGYHFYIRLDGTVYTGRPITMIGAHTQGYNTGSIGVVFEGDFSKNMKLTQDQFSAFVDLKTYLDGQVGKTLIIKGHKEAPYPTECPGDYFPLEDIKACKKANSIGWDKNSTGWFYYYDENGSYYKASWQKIGTYWYYFDNDGYIYENKWCKYQDQWCYLKHGGYMARIEWLCISGKWYYFNESGYMVTLKWVEDKEKKGVWYYTGPDGVMLTSAWVTDNGKKYYLNEKGQMVTNCVIDGTQIGPDGIAK